MTWFRALRDTARSGLAVDRSGFEPLLALRGALGLAVVVGGTLALFGPLAAVSSAFGAFQAVIATFQRSWRPRPVLALASGGSLAVSTFVGYLTVGHLVLFTALIAVWTLASGLAWALGPTVGIIASSNVAIMLVTITLPTSVATAAGHAAVIAAGGVVQAGRVWRVPGPPPGAPPAPPPPEPGALRLRAPPHHGHLATGPLVRGWGHNPPAARCTEP
ncbi:hypothetical protein [Streptomyces sp. NPDC058953]|uniref:hypothetical protein n=1 Tax=Streptomyces sp. NPDC058953 TaxID=3346676 RepID=UPI0036B702EA